MEDTLSSIYEERRYLHCINKKEHDIVEEVSPKIKHILQVLHSTHQTLTRSTHSESPKKQSQGWFGFFNSHRGLIAGTILLGVGVGVALMKGSENNKSSGNK